ncbi:hypothetical protein BN133_2732 [Cronobacter dublinensis 582]|nr:hypothetical protein BN133_2732 [Cronobacter dublinensis 582]
MRFVEKKVAMKDGDNDPGNDTWSERTQYRKKRILVFTDADIFISAPLKRSPYIFSTDAINLT